MRKLLALVTTVTMVVAVSTATLSADRVRLRSGQTVEGSLLGADVKVVRFLLGNGNIVSIKAEEISAIEFEPRRPPAEAAPNPAKAAAPITVPKDTVLSVRLTQAIDVDAAHAGATFKSVLSDPVMMNGKVVIPRNAQVMLQATKVEQAGKMKGSDNITLKANTVAFGGTRYDIVTNYVEQKGKGEGKKTAKKVGAGAGLGGLIGGIAGGGTGVAIGMAVGAATGAIVSSQGTEHLQLPAETSLQFQLAAAVTVQP
jgi:hypothetical protein